VNCSDLGCWIEWELLGICHEHTKFIVRISGNSAANSATENAATRSSSANNGGVGTTSTPARSTYDPPHLQNRPPVFDSLVAYSGIVSCSDHLGYSVW
jgi:hypothetical protein